MDFGNPLRQGHTAIMCSVFVVLMPLGSLLVYLPAGSKTIRYIHAPFQILNVCLAIGGLVLGVLLCSPGEPSSYHAIMGYVAVGLIALVQPSLGLLQHLLFRKTGQRTIFGITHRWLGRGIIILGMTTGGFGFLLAGPVGNNTSPVWAVVVYSIVAGLIMTFYTTIVIWQTRNMGGKNLVDTKERFSSDSQRSIISLSTISNPDRPKW